MDRKERFEGCLLGGAVGDALGAGIEFLTLDSIRNEHGPAGVTEMTRAYGGVGMITDDTQMSLFTAEGLLRSYVASELGGEADLPAIVYESYLRWLATQGEALPILNFTLDGWLLSHRELFARRAPGMTCLSALRTGKPGTRDEPANASKGCGGVMRMAPVGLVALDSFEIGADLAALTHGHPAGYHSAGALALIIRQIVRDWPLREAISLVHQRLDCEADSAEVLAAIGAALSLANSTTEPGPEAVESLGAGWVAEEALAIALYCALVAKDFRHGVLLAVNHGGDSDSTGAIAGNLLGSMFGVCGIPADWLCDLQLRSVIEQLAEDLYLVATGKAPKAQSGLFRDWTARYPPR